MIKIHIEYTHEEITADELEVLFNELKIDFEKNENFSEDMKKLFLSVKINFELVARDIKDIYMEI